MQHRANTNRHLSTGSQRYASDPLKHAKSRKVLIIDFEKIFCFFFVYLDFEKDFDSHRSDSSSVAVDPNNYLIPDSGLAMDDLRSPVASTSGVVYVPVLPPKGKKLKKKS